jgi:hypothetical protein
MDPSFIPIETVPSKAAFGLDQLRRSYKTDLSAEDAVAAAPDIAGADEVFPKMFLVDIATPEPAGSATRIDLIYKGCIKTDGDGNPIFPSQKHEYDDAVQSASSKRAQSGTILGEAVTAEYYAPTRVLSYISFNGIGTAIAADPDQDPRVITITVGDTTLAIGVLVQNLIDALFTVQIVQTFKSTEIVPGKYWQNESKKIKSLSPWIFNLTAGAYVVYCAQGWGYTVGDTLTISFGGESAVLVVTRVGPGGYVLGWTVSSNTFTVPRNILYATGGTGTGAAFNIIVI